MLPDPGKGSRFQITILTRSEHIEAATQEAHDDELIGINRDQGWMNKRSAELATLDFERENKKPGSDIIDLKRLPEIIDQWIDGSLQEEDRRRLTPCFSRLAEVKVAVLGKQLEDAQAQAEKLRRDNIATVSKMLTVFRRAFLLLVFVILNTLPQPYCFLGFPIIAYILFVGVKDLLELNHMLRELTGKTISPEQPLDGNTVAT